MVGLKAHDDIRVLIGPSFIDINRSPSTLHVSHTGQRIHPKTAAPYGFTNNPKPHTIVHTMAHVNEGGDVRQRGFRVVVEPHVQYIAGEPPLWPLVVSRSARVDDIEALLPTQQAVKLYLADEYGNVQENLVAQTTWVALPIRLGIDPNDSMRERSDPAKHYYAVFQPDWLIMPDGRFNRYKFVIRVHNLTDPNDVRPVSTAQVLASPWCTITREWRRQVAPQTFIPAPQWPGESTFQLRFRSANIKCNVVYFFLVLLNILHLITWPAGINYTYVIPQQVVWVAQLACWDVFRIFNGYHIQGRRSNECRAGYIWSGREWEYFAPQQQQ
jgi:hypothetical protein